MTDERADIDELLDTLADVLSQACSRTNDEYMSSDALSAYAAGLRLLAKHRRATIIRERGRVVVAQLGSSDATKTS